MIRITTMSHCIEQSTVPDRPMLDRRAGLSDAERRRAMSREIGSDAHVMFMQQQQQQQQSSVSLLTICHIATDADSLTGIRSDANVRCC